MSRRPSDETISRDVRLRLKQDALRRSTLHQPLESKYIQALADEDVFKLLMVEDPSFVEALEHQPDYYTNLVRTHIQRHEGRDAVRYTFLGNLHNMDDQPAVVWKNGTREWYTHGVRDRANDLPAVEDVDGSRLWYRDGHLYRQRNIY